MSPMMHYKQIPQEFFIEASPESLLFYMKGHTGEHKWRLPRHLDLMWGEHPLQWQLETEPKISYVKASIEWIDEIN